MSKVERFEDLVAWQKARVWTRDVDRTALQGKVGKDFILSKQIRSAALSVLSNIAEGFERGSRNEFHQFLSIAKSSCAEVRSDLYLAMDIGYVCEQQGMSLLQDGEEVARIGGGLRAAVARQRTRRTPSSVLSPQS